jgi:hypothetical protein
MPTVEPFSWNYKPVEKLLANFYERKILFWPMNRAYYHNKN